MDNKNFVPSVIIAAICYLCTIAAVVAYYGKLTEALGIAAAITGLIGVLKLPHEGSSNG